MRDYLSKLIKKILEENPTSPPTEVWQNITNGLDINEVWNSLETQLDLNQVWDDVTETIGHTHQIIRYDQFSNIASAAILLLSLSYGYLSITINTSNVSKLSPILTESAFVSPNQDQLNTASNANQSNQVNSDLNTDSSPNSVDNGLNETSIEQNTAEENIAPNQLLAEMVRIELADNEGLNRNTFASIAFENSLLKSRLNQGLVTTATGFRADSLLAYSKIPTNVNVPPKWYIGLTGGIKNNWLINSKTINNFSSESLNSTDFDINAEYGILGGYHLNKNFAIQLEAYIYSGEGQRYHEYVGGNYLPTSVDLNYQKVELLLKKKNYRLASIQRKLNTNYLFGVFLGHLRKASENIGGEKASLDDSFSRYNVGIIVGYELSYHISEFLSINPSIRVRYGLNSIYNSDPSETNFLRSSKTASVGLNVGVHYSIFK